MGRFYIFRNVSRPFKRPERNSAKRKQQEGSCISLQFSSTGCQHQHHNISKLNFPYFETSYRIPSGPVNLLSNQLCLLVAELSTSWLKLSCKVLYPENKSEMMGMRIINSVVLRLWRAAELPEGSVKCRLAGLSHRATDSTEFGRQPENLHILEYFSDSWHHTLRVRDITL